MGFYSAWIILVIISQHNGLTTTFAPGRPFAEKEHCEVAKKSYPQSETIKTYCVMVRI